MLRFLFLTFRGPTDARKSGYPEIFYRPRHEDIETLRVNLQAIITIILFLQDKIPDMKNRTNLILIIICFWASQLYGQSHPPKIYQSIKTNGKINIDGFANEAAWDRALWSDDFVDIEGEAKPIPKYKTRMKILWDENALYIFAQLEDPHVWASITERDQVIFYDNDFEIFIDPDGDNHNYFELEVNAFSTAFDLFMTMPYNAGGSALIGWDINGLEVATQITGSINNPKDIDERWTVEMAIPWQSMLAYAPGKSPPQNGDVWRINFSRVQWQTEIVDGEYKKAINPVTGKPFPESNWVWSPQGVIDMHRPETWGYIAFTDQPSEREITILEADPFFKEKQVLLALYNKQKVFLKQNKRYAESLYELDKQGRNTAQNIFIEATSKQFLISTNTENGNTVYIDHQKRIWLE